MRDDFLASTKRIVAGRAGYRCANPRCRRATIGPNADPERAAVTGVAAHISAASPGGPRYDAGLTRQARRAIGNAIWLCQGCAHLVDVDERYYTVRVLRRWRAEAERRARNEVAGFIREVDGTNAGWVWHPADRTYHNVTTGKILTLADTVRMRDDVLVNTACARADHLTSALFRRRISLAAWQTRLLWEIKYVYIISYTLGHGGVRSLTPEATRTFSPELRRRYKQLQRLAQDIVAGEYDVGRRQVRLVDAQASVRALIESVRTAVAWP